MREALRNSGGHSNVIELGLRHQHSDSSFDVLRPVLDRALATLATFAAGKGDQAQVASFRERIEHCRGTLATGDAKIAAAETMDCLSTFSLSVARVNEGERRPEEIVSLITLVRDAVAALAGGVETADASVSESMTRLDYLSRVTDPEMLRAQLAIEVSLLKEIAVNRKRQWETTLKRFNSQVESLEQELVQARVAATTDPLTRLANRRAFEGACTELMKQPMPQFVLAMIDVDNFKTINDDHGHVTGDRVLTSVAQRLQSSLRGSDVVGRLGGDEFGILAAGITLSLATTRMQGVVKSMVETPVTDPDGTPLKVTLSIGLAEFSAGDNPQTLIKRADGALYDAKHGGKNRVIVRTAPLMSDLMKGRFVRR
jgi:diguanylate cyclase (GGDEF)-like protein